MKRLYVAACVPALWLHIFLQDHAKKPISRSFKFSTLSIFVIKESLKLFRYCSSGLKGLSSKIVIFFCTEVGLTSNVVEFCKQSKSTQLHGMTLCDTVVCCQENFLFTHSPTKPCMEAGTLPKLEVGKEDVKEKEEEDGEENWKKEGKVDRTQD